MPGYNNPGWIEAIESQYRDNYSIERIICVWPKITPWTHVYHVPSYSKTWVMRFPIFDPGAVLADNGYDMVLNFSTIDIKLDTAHADSRGYYQYGYNAEHDILVYREIDNT